MAKGGKKKPNQSKGAKKNKKNRPMIQLPGQLSVLDSAGHR